MKGLVTNLIKIYQRFFSFETGLPHRLFPEVRLCRFEPTCSQYTYEAVEKYGVVKGVTLGLKRILRCQPLNRGGWDPLK